jgi:hypothetical protein
MRNSGLSGKAQVRQFPATPFMRSHPYLILSSNWFYGNKRHEAGKAWMFSQM